METLSALLVSLAKIVPLVEPFLAWCRNWHTSTPLQGKSERRTETKVSYRGFKFERSVVETNEWNDRA